MPRQCSYRTLQINHDNEVWCITQDIRRHRNPRTGEKYLGRLSPKQEKYYIRIMKIRLVIRLKSWKKPTQAYLKAVGFK